MSEDKKNRGPIVVSADWAPRDPRDRLYDPEASELDKAASAYRIFSSFHPVLNLAVLFHDSFKRFGLLRAGMIWVTIIAVPLLMFWLSKA